MNNNDTGLDLVAFVGAYTQLIEKQLIAIRQMMTTTVESIMADAKEISQSAEKSSNEAEKLMQAAFMQPDQATQSLVENVQKAVTGLFEEASQVLQDSGKIDGLKLKNKLEHNDVTQLKEVARTSAALQKLDERLQAMVINAMGSLSSEDVMVQRIDHVILSMKALETSLSYILLDYSQRATPEKLAMITGDLKDYTLRQYTSEEEKTEFALCFPDYPKAG